MYRSLLSYSQLKSYLDLLEERRMIEFDEETNHFKLTDRAVKFLDVYSDIEKLMSGVYSRN